MYIYMYTCIYIYIYMCTCMCVYTCVCVCVYIIYTHVHACVCACMCTHNTYTHVYIHVHVYIYTCVYKYICVYSVHALSLCPFPFICLSPPLLFARNFVFHNHPEFWMEVGHNMPTRKENREPKPLVSAAKKTLYRYLQDPRPMQALDGVHVTRCGD
jgi:hypothetical protein